MVRGVAITDAWSPVTFAFFAPLRETSFMQTVTTISPQNAAGFIKRGGIVAFPTETVYGLGANVFDETAIAKIFEAKRRPADNPLIAHVATREQIQELTTEITECAEKFIHKFFPGPLTVVLTKSDKVPFVATAGLNTIGVRMPHTELAQRFLAACGVPVVAPSANLSGRPSPTTWEAVLEDLDGRIDCILQGDATEIGLESTVVDCTGDLPVLLRAGAISLAELQAVVSGTVVYEASDSDTPRSPGMRHRHYSPRARVVIADRGLRIANFEEKPRSLPLSVLTGGAAYIGLRAPETQSHQQTALPVLTSRVCSSVEEYAHEVFEFFRECDRSGITTIYCETVDETGIGAALMDRLRRAEAE